MSCTYHQCLAVYVAVFFGTSMIFPPVACLINVPNLLRVRAGKGAVFMWNTTKAIQHLEWGIKDPNSDSIATRFMYTNKLSNQLLIDGGITLTNYSGRVSFVGELRLGHAWFKITNLSVADTNMYGANIQESGQTTRTFSAVALQVTASLAFTRAPPAITTTKEGDDLKIQCSANGPPTPQIKWFYNGTILSQGNGSATLSITDINRNQHGIYECQASNNPNEEPIKAATGVMVFYKPIIDKTASSNHTHSWKGNTLTLKCVVASGLPSPDLTWYKPNGDVLPCTQCSRTVSSQVTIHTGQDRADYGLYRCTATNVVGSDQHYVNVTQLFPPGLPLNIIFTDIEASSVAVRWTEPEYDGGSRVLQYNLTIDSKTIFVDAPNTQQSINGLAKNTNYEVKLSAMNMVGYGNASSKNFTTKKPDSTLVYVVYGVVTVCLLVITLLLWYIWRIKTRTRPNQRRRDNFPYDNEMATIIAPSSDATPRTPAASQASVEAVEYNEIPPRPVGNYEALGNRKTNQDDENHYQHLDPSTRNRQVEGNMDINKETSPDIGHYQELQPRSTASHSDPKTTYEPLHLK